MLLHWTFSSSRDWGLLSACCAQASHCSDFSCCGTRALECTGFIIVAYGLSSCSSQALSSTGSVVGAHRLSCFAVCEILIRDRTHVSCNERWLLYTEPPRKPSLTVYIYIYNSPNFKKLYSIQRDTYVSFSPGGLLRTLYPREPGDVVGDGKLNGEQDRLEELIF